MKDIKKEFEEKFVEDGYSKQNGCSYEFIPYEDCSDAIFSWIEKKLKEAYTKGETRGHHLGYQQAAKSIPSFKDAIDVLKSHLEDNYEGK